jgi:hypothetical protein
MSLFRKEKKVTLTRNQAMHISFCLERLRLGYDNAGSLTNEEVRSFEDIIDSQVWGSEYVANRTLVNQALAKTW